MYRAITALVGSWLVAALAWALSRFPDQYDFYLYHLGASLGMWGRTTFTPKPWTAALIAGYPPIAHAVQGALMVATGKTQAVVLAGPLGWAVAVAGVGWLTRDRRKALWFAVLSLGIPLVAIHIVVPYIDLWSGSFTALAIFAALERPAPGRRGPSGRAALVFVLASAIAAGSKMQTWPLLAVTWLAAAVTWLGSPAERLDRARVRGTGRAVAVLALAAVVVGIWPVRNAVRFGNPTYPYAPPGLARWIKPASIGIDPEADLDIQAPAYLRDWPYPVGFVASALEAGRLVEPTLDYSHDMFLHPTAPGRYPVNHRMGGWGVWMVALAAAWWWSLRRADPRAAVRAGAVLLALAAVVAVLPHSHELRYWLALPLSALALLVRDHFEFIERRRWWALACVVFSLGVTARPVLKANAESIEKVAPPEAQEFWRTAEPGHRYEIAEAPWSIFWAGPDFDRIEVTETDP